MASMNNKELNEKVKEMSEEAEILKQQILLQSEECTDV